LKIKEILSLKTSLYYGNTEDRRKEDTVSLSEADRGKIDHLRSFQMGRYLFWMNAAIM